MSQKQGRKLQQYFNREIRSQLSSVNKKPNWCPGFIWSWMCRLVLRDYIVDIVQRSVNKKNQ